jgi:hypothetical protein
VIPVGVTKNAIGGDNESLAEPVVVKLEALNPLVFSQSQQRAFT